MSQAREPDDRDLDRTLRSLDFPEERLRQRRISRLEDTQTTWRELDKSFVGRSRSVSERRPAFGNLVHDKFDEIHARMNVQFGELSKKLAEGNQKLDLILLHITGQGNS
jgi:hypothetical protein